MANRRDAARGVLGSRRDHGCSWGGGSWGRCMHRSLRGRVLGAVESGATGGSATWTAPRKRAPGAGAVAGGWVGDDTGLVWQC